MFKLLIFGLACYGAYHLFIKPKVVYINKDEKKNKSYTDYEEVD